MVRYLFVWALRIENDGEPAVLVEDEASVGERVTRVGVGEVVNSEPWAQSVGDKEGESVTRANALPALAETLADLLDLEAKEGLSMAVSATNLLDLEADLLDFPSTRR